MYRYLFRFNKVMKKNISRNGPVVGIGQCTVRLDIIFSKQEQC